MVGVKGVSEERRWQQPGPLSWRGFHKASEVVTPSSPDSDGSENSITSGREAI